MVTFYRATNGKYSYEQLLEIIRLLRAPNGCPWDRAQTHESIRNNFLEEAYEAVDAIDRGDMLGLREELGDVLLQLLLHAVMAEEDKQFSFDDVVDELCEKLIFRHPHVFGDVKADTTEKVLENWDALKRVEKSQDTFSSTVDSVPVAFPALMRCAKVQRRAGKAGVGREDEPYFSDLMHQSFSLALKQPDKASIGRLLFSVVAYARQYDIDCEEALSRTVTDFADRFREVELRLNADGQDLTDLPHAEQRSLFEGS